ncbi:PEP-CTERM sorting domain-containing protein [Janthinobacterium agaricidamnosum]|uniref:PEP-CTERM putative exosortase interaction domain protein n=1 Tax=Janthinobacterium agaricidamnosum NBRC 102515 = DSM 9628 TaxID=1349767 RepID=W0VCZ9_9BURK|nr:PEP-CTERM sorting domain-containing protein [Janthinobacterium agaricidamnosum]CDG85177.1 PEP-CTERM putative exosortase interaction domain protein [Janthinobacterium agaricidamnosum NBRC 102515 = DSM 9628]
MKFVSVISALATLLYVGSAQATVVNISALWGQNPMMTAGHDASQVGVGTILHLDAGEYRVTPVDQTFEGARFTAASRFGNYNYEWSMYISIDGAPGVKYGYGEGWATSTDWRYWSTPAQAFAAAPQPFSFTLNKATDVKFYWIDNYFSDNVGGISFNVSAVPEPDSTALLLAGLSVIVCAGLRRKALQLPDHKAG